MNRTVYDSVLTRDLLTCGRKFYYLHVEGWRTRKMSVDLFFGQLYASALEKFHRLQAEGTSQEDALITIVHDTLKATWKDGKPWDSEGHVKNRETLIRTIVWYIDQFGDKDSMRTVILADGRPAVELSFTFELSSKYAYSGHLDRLVEYNGDIYVQDQKSTKSTLAPYYFVQIDHPEVQMTGYAFAGKIIYNSPVKGVVIDAAQIAVGFSRFERGFTGRTEAQLQEWQATVLHHITEAEHGNYPMRPTSCGAYGGCMFRSVCNKDPSLRENFLKADFVKGPLWDPEHKR